MIARILIFEAVLCFSCVNSIGSLGLEVAESSDFRTSDSESWHDEENPVDTLKFNRETGQIQCRTNRNAIELNKQLHAHN